jgi:DNA-binding SARP family transcriptional activator
MSAYATWLEEARLECMEMLVQASLECGRHREVIGWLHQLIAKYPLHEVFYQYLMVALYRSDRQGEALEIFRSARKVLRTELGIDPCPAMQDLHGAILAGERLYA